MLKVFRAFSLSLLCLALQHLLCIICWKCYALILQNPNKKQLTKLLFHLNWLFAILPSYSLSLLFNAFLWQSNSESEIYFVWYKVPLPAPKSSPQGQARRWTCLAADVFPCYTMQLNVFWGIGGEKEGGVRFPTHGKKVMKCAFAAMIFVSADSMPCSLCCETYNHSLLASLHSTGLHLRIGVLVIELHNRWRKSSRSSQALRRWSSLCFAAACFLSHPTVHSKLCMSNGSSSLAVHRWLVACENFLKSLAKGLMLVAIMLHPLRICGLHLR